MFDSLLVDARKHASKVGIEKRGDMVRSLSLPLSRVH